jgi:Uma2 family endonuclease
VNYFEGRSIGEVFDAPIDLILTQHDVLVPDLLVASDPRQISQRGIEGAPLLAVEILSPSTRRFDLGPKAQRYAELGLQHYWVVDPDQKRMECNRLEGSAYRQVVEGQGNLELTHPDWDGLVIDLSALWR